VMDGLNGFKPNVILIVENYESPYIVYMSKGHTKHDTMLLN